MASETSPDRPDDDLGVPPLPGARRFTARPLLLPDDDPAEAGDGTAAAEVDAPEGPFEAPRVASVDEFFGAPADDPAEAVDDEALDEVMPADPSSAVQADASFVWPHEAGVSGCTPEAADATGAADVDFADAPFTDPPFAGEPESEAEEPGTFDPQDLAFFSPDIANAEPGEAGPRAADDAVDVGDDVESEGAWPTSMAESAEFEPLDVSHLLDLPSDTASESPDEAAAAPEVGLDTLDTEADVFDSEADDLDSEADPVASEADDLGGDASDIRLDGPEAGFDDASDAVFEDLLGLDVEEEPVASPSPETRDPEDAHVSEIDVPEAAVADLEGSADVDRDTTELSPEAEVPDEAEVEGTPAEGVPAATAAVDEAFEAQADTEKADAPAPSGIEGTLDVPLLGPEDFEAAELKRVLRLMLTARRLDEKMLMLLKQGKGFFHIGSSGHEASQIAIGTALEGGRDWFSCYYRDLATVLAAGFEPIDVLRGHYAKATDPSSGGRQMSEHFASRELNIFSPSSSVAAQYMPAVGFGLAIRRSGPEGAAVYASGGEGSTSQGAFHEALNWAAKEALPLVFHIQDNKYAISVPVAEQTAGGSIWHLLGGYAGLERVRYDGTDFFASASVARAAVAHVRAGNGPVALLADVVRLLPHSSSDDHKKYREADALEADRARDPIPRFAARLVEAGVVTEEEVEAMREEVRVEVDALARQVEAEPDPDPASATKHVVYEGEDARVYEADGETGDLVVMVDAINHALDEEMARDERVLVYGEDVGGGKGGVFTATRGLTEKHGRDRCFNSPLAEHSIIGSAVGLAAAGYTPVVEIQFADYIWPAMQPLRNQVAPLRYRSNGTWACPMVIRVPCGGYIHGGLCHSQNVEAIFAHFPGLQVVMPSNAADAKGLLKAAIRGEDPVLFLEHKSLYRQGPARSPEPHDEYLVPIGKARLAREGTDLTVVTWGALVYKALNVAKALEREGVSVEVIDLRSILPYDAEAVLASVRKTGRVLIAHEDHGFMGFGAEIAAQLADDAFGHLDAPVRRVAGAFSWIPFADPLEKAVLPQDDDVLAAARAVLDF